MGALARKDWPYSLGTIDGIFDDLDRDFKSLFGAPFFRRSSLTKSVEATDKGYAVSVELPGFKPEEVGVEIDGSVLSISAKRENNEKQHKFSLPSDVNLDSVSAKLELGVLTVTLGKQADRTTVLRKVEVK